MKTFHFSSIIIYYTPLVFVFYAFLSLMLLLLVLLLHFYVGFAVKPVYIYWNYLEIIVNTFELICWLICTISMLITLMCANLGMCSHRFACTLYMCVSQHLSIIQFTVKCRFNWIYHFVLVLVIVCSQNMHLMTNTYIKWNFTLMSRIPSATKD